MSDKTPRYKGATPAELMAVACQAVAILCNKDPDLVKPDENGEVFCTGDSCAIIINAEDDPSALVFRTYLLEDISESPAMYALLNEINATITIGQLYYNEECRDIIYYYQYPIDKPSADVVATIIETMINVADLYDDRLKIRLGGKRFIETEDDEVEV
jgi:hypothetical protein